MLYSHPYHLLLNTSIGTCTRTWMALILDLGVTGCQYSNRELTNPSAQKTGGHERAGGAYRQRINHTSPLP